MPTPLGCNVMRISSAAKLSLLASPSLSLLSRSRLPRQPSHSLSSEGLLAAPLPAIRAPCQPRGGKGAAPPTSLFTSSQSQQLLRSGGRPQEEGWGEGFVRSAPPRPPENKEGTQPPARGERPSRGPRQQSARVDLSKVFSVGPVREVSPPSESSSQIHKHHAGARPSSHAAVPAWKDGSLSLPASRLPEALTSSSIPDPASCELLLPYSPMASSRRFPLPLTALPAGRGASTFSSSGGFLTICIVKP